VVGAVVVILSSADRQLTMGETIPFRHVWLCRAHSYFDALEAIILGSLMFVSSALSAYTDHPAYVAYEILLVLGVTAVTIGHVVFPPYYHKPVRYFKITTLSFLWWSSITEIFLRVMMTSGWESKFGALNMYVN
jgi:hypothetical protein